MNLFERISMHPQETDEGKKRILKITDKLAIMTSALAFSLGAILYHITQNGLIFYPAMIEGCLFLAILPLNRFGRSGYGMKVMFVLQNFAIWYFGLILGPASMIHSFFIFLGLCAWLVYQRMAARIGAMAILAVILALIELNYEYHIIPQIEMSVGSLRILRWLVIITDILLTGTVMYYFIRENIRNEQLKLANQAITVYAKKISHEIRSPLNVLNGIVQHYTDAIDPDKKTLQMGVAHMEVLLNCSKDMELVVNNALSWSKIEAGVEDVNNEPLMLVDWLGNLTDTYYYLARTRAVHILTDIGEGVPVCIYADKSKLRSILANMLSNAIKFTQHRSIINLKVTTTGTVLHFSVTDQGGGIADDMKERVFDPFVSMASQHTEATGLGLPIARGLARVCFKGDLTVSNNPDRPGSRFLFTMPYKIAHEVVEQPKTAINFAAFSGSNILAVDDDSNNLLIVSLMLKGSGINVVKAASAAQAMELINKQQPDIILLDRHMPVISGIELLHQIKSDKTLRHIPVAIISGNAYEEEKEEIIAAGAEGYLYKPLNRQKLYELLAEHLHQVTV